MGSGSGLCEVCLDFRERHFKGVKIWGTRRQEQDPGSLFAYALLGPGAFVEGHIVQDHDVALAQCRDSRV